MDGLLYLGCPYTSVFFFLERILLLLACWQSKLLPLCNHCHHQHQHHRHTISRTLTLALSRLSNHIQLTHSTLQTTGLYNFHIRNSHFNGAIVSIYCLSILHIESHDCFMYFDQQINKYQNLRLCILLIWTWIIQWIAEQQSISVSKLTFHLEIDNISIQL